MVQPDYYELLGVDRDATSEQIRAAYRRAVKGAHPDAGGTAGMFRLLTEAYETLIDPARRTGYDEAQAAPATPQPDQAAQPEPEWGEEMPVDAEWHPGDDNGVSDQPPDPYWRRPARPGFGISILIMLIFGLPIAGVLVFWPGLLHPDAAQDDLYVELTSPWSNGVVVGVYGLMVVGYLFEAEHHATILADFLAVFCLFAWPLAYWDVATGSEWGVYVALVVSWLVYRFFQSVAARLAPAPTG